MTVLMMVMSQQIKLTSHSLLGTITGIAADTTELHQGCAKTAFGTSHWEQLKPESKDITFVEDDVETLRLLTVPIVFADDGDNGDDDTV